MNRVARVLSSEDWLPWTCQRCAIKMKVCYELDDRRLLCRGCGGGYTCRYDYWDEKTPLIGIQSITITICTFDYEYVTSLGLIQLEKI